MRRLFLVFAKLLGLLQIYSVIMTPVQIWLFFTMPAPDGSSLLINLIVASTCLVLAFGFAWLLLVRTEWLADKLGVQDATDVSDLERHPALSVGVQLLGIYFTVHVTPNLVRWILCCYNTWALGLMRDFWGEIIPDSVQLGLGVFLMLASDKVVAMIAKKKRSASPEDEDVVRDVS